MRIPIASDLKTRTGAPDKDARIKNGYIETKGDQSVVRKRPIAQGGIAIGTGQAQGGIGFTIGSTPYFIGFWADTMQTYTGGGTSWNSGTSYSIGNSVSVDFVDYWAVADNTNSQPPSVNWSRSYVPASGITYATLNPSDKGPSITLSNGNLTATITSFNAVRSTIGKSSGKWYWEYTINTYDFTTTNMELGIALSSATLLSVVGIDASGWAFMSGSNGGADSKKFHSNTSAAYGAPYRQGDNIGIALDADIGAITFYLNGISQGVAFNTLGTGNLIYAAVSGNPGLGSQTVTANFGRTAFLYSVPAGYNSGLYQ